MKNTLPLLALLLLPFMGMANSDSTEVAVTDTTIELDEESLELIAFYAFQDSVDKALEWHHGTVDLGDGLAELVVPEGYKYLGKEQTEFLMSDVFGNMYEPSLGLIAHESFNLLDDVDDYFVEITYAEGWLHRGRRRG